MKLHKLIFGSLAGILTLSATAFATPTEKADRMSVAQDIQQLETVQAEVQQEAERRVGYNGRAAREKLDQLNGVIEQLQQRKPVSPEAVDRSLLR